MNDLQIKTLNTGRLLNFYRSVRDKMVHSRVDVGDATAGLQYEELKELRQKLKAELARRPHLARR